MAEGKVTCEFAVPDIVKTVHGILQNAVVAMKHSAPLSKIGLDRQIPVLLYAAWLEGKIPGPTANQAFHFYPVEEIPDLVQLGICQVDIFVLADPKDKAEDTVVIDGVPYGHPMDVHR